MSRAHITYFEAEDVLHLVICDEPEARSIDLGPNITAELNTKGELIGVEILNASEFLREAVLAKTVALVKSGEPDRGDIDIISRRADALNAEAEDVLGYQEML